MTGLSHFAPFETFFNEFCMRPSGHNATQFHLPLNLKKFLTTFKATLRELGHISAQILVHTFTLSPQTYEAHL